MCFDCGNKRARYPKADPAFCTKTCAAEYAAAYVVDWDYDFFPCIECKDGTRGDDCFNLDHHTVITVADQMIAAIDDGFMVR